MSEETWFEITNGWILFKDSAVQINNITDYRYTGDGLSISVPGKYVKWWEGLGLGVGSNMELYHEKAKELFVALNAEAREI